MALELAREAGLEASDDSWALQRTLVNELAAPLAEPDHGLWEIRGPQRSTSRTRRLMVWVAFDRAVRAVETHGLEGPVDEWRALRDRGARGGAQPVASTHGRNTFVQHYDTTEVDASLLTIAVGRLPRRATTRRCSARSRPSSRPDARRPVAALPDRDRRRRRRRRRAPVPGLLVLAGVGVRPAPAARRREAADGAPARRSPTTSACSPRSTTSPARGWSGNFPQAFSHLALVGAAMTLHLGSPA